jgi:hypothetical protein
MSDEAGRTLLEVRGAARAAVSPTPIRALRHIRAKPSYERLDIDTLDERELDAFPDRTIYQTFAWLRFIGKTQGAEPVVAALRKGDQTLGYFSGLLIKKFGVRILGSPFPGWNTLYMGFNLLPEVSRRMAIMALEEFAFNELHCHHLELMDRDVKPEDYSDLGFKTWMLPSYELDLRPSEGQIFATFKHVVRTNLRKAASLGVTVEEAHGDDFIEEHFRQLEHVYAEHGATIPYNVDRVRNLIEIVKPTGGLLLLRARNRDGFCIATAILAALNDTAFYHSAASWRPFVKSRPNEAIVWYAIKYFKRQGMRFLDLGGASEYQKKFGGYPIAVPWIRKSRSRSIAFLRSAAEFLFYERRHIVGLLRRALG